MFGIAAEFEDVPLREAHVLDEHPDGMGEVGRFLAAECGRQVSDGVAEFGVRSAAGDEIGEIFAQMLITVGGHEVLRVGEEISVAEMENGSMVTVRCCAARGSSVCNAALMRRRFAQDDKGRRVTKHKVL